ncbi:MAG: hypothetical protein RIC55_34230 [Pirellulaceae bacterium]
MLKQQSPPSKPATTTAASGDREATAERLAWRVPSHVSSLRLSARSLRVLLSGVLALALGIALSTGSSWWPALAVGTVSISALSIYWYSRSRRAAASQEDNVWLDQHGLHWSDGVAEGALPRQQIEGFRLGLDPDTVRAIPALTLILVGGFESQPVELHAPATPTDVRAFLMDQWRLEEIALEPRRQAALLYRTFETSLSAADSPSDAEYFLLACLMEPEAREDGTWRVFYLPREIEVDYDPTTARLHVTDDRAEEVQTLAALVAFVDQRVLPGDPSQRKQVLAKAEDAAGQEYQQHVAADMHAMRLQVDRNEAARRWSFAGDRASLAALSDSIEGAARCSPPPAGARPIQVRHGGLYFGVTFEVNHYEGIADDVLCATPETLGDLAKWVHKQAVDGPLGESNSLPVDLGNATWTIAVAVREDGFDPAAIESA